MVQWLRLGVFTAMTRVQSLVGELRSHKLHSQKKKKEEKKRNKRFMAWSIGAGEPLAHFEQVSC